MDFLPADSRGTTQAAYNSAFFNKMDAEAYSSARVIVPIVREYFKVDSVCDVGCGLGQWAGAFAEGGASTVLGLDGQWVDQSQLAIPRDCFQVTPLDQAWAINGSFDLCVCLEVAEHLPSSKSQHLVKQLTRAAEAILFSAAIPGQQGTYHINEQWPEYWEELFSRFGFLKLDVLRPRIWRDARVAWYYQQNVVLYVQDSLISRVPELKAARCETTENPLTLIHPKSLSPLRQLKPATQNFICAARRALHRRLRRDH